LLRGIKVRVWQRPKMKLLESDPKDKSSHAVKIGSLLQDASQSLTRSIQRRKGQGACLPQ
jgi:hypothetical protein